MNIELNKINFNFSSQNKLNRTKQLNINIEIFTKIKLNIKLKYMRRKKKQKEKRKTISSPDYLPKRNLNLSLISVCLQIIKNSTKILRTKKKRKKTYYIHNSQT